METTDVLSRVLRVTASLGVISALGCTGVRGPETEVVLDPSLAAGEDVDAQFEKRFRDGELELDPVEPRSATIAALSARPFLDVPLTDAGTELAMADEAGADDDVAGVEIHVFAIGQADSMLVIGPPPERRTLLVDVGETGWNSRRNCQYVRDRVAVLTGEASVDYLVLTHYHTDHAGYPRTVSSTSRIQGGGGAFCLLDGTTEFFSVETLIDRGDGELAFKPDRQKIHEAIIASESAWIQNGTLTRRVAADFTPGLIDLGPGIEVEVIATAGHVFPGDAGALAKAEQNSPNTYSQDWQASPNDFSVGLEISVGDFEMVTAGDLTGAPGIPPYPDFTRNAFGQIYTNVESHMIDYWSTQERESDVEVYRVNHHGSRNSSTVDLVNVLEPEVVIYSCGGRHHHPSRTIAERFLDLGSDQIVTSSVDPEEWADDGFPGVYGNGWQNPVGDILIFVPLSGDSYVIGTENQVFEYPALSDEEEAEEAVGAGGLSIEGAVPNPVGNDRMLEEVHLINTGEDPVALDGWRIGDSSGSDFWFLSSADGVVQPEETDIIIRNGRPMALNNSGDTIVLIDPSGTIVDERTYDRASSGEILRFD